MISSTNLNGADNHPCTLFSDDFDFASAFYEVPLGDDINRTFADLHFSARS